MSAPPRKNKNVKKRYRTDIDTDTQVAIMLGSGWNTNEVAAFFGVTHVAIVNRRARNRDFISKVIEWTQMACDRVLAERIKDAEDEIAQRKKSIHKKGYRVIEKALDHALEQPASDMPQKEHLTAAEMGIDRSEGKSVQRNVNANLNMHTRDVSVTVLDDVLGELAHINEMRRPAVLGPATEPEQNIERVQVQEAELVPSK